MRPSARRSRRPAARVASAREAVEIGRGLANLSQIAGPGPSTSLNGPIGPHRRWDWARSRLSDVKQIRDAHGGTVNDVVLAAITRGFRDLLLGRGEQVEGRIVRTLVPVSVRARARARRLRQQGVGDVRRAAGRDR